MMARRFDATGAMTIAAGVFVAAAMMPAAAGWSVLPSAVAQPQQVIVGPVNMPVAGPRTAFGAGGSSGKTSGLHIPQQRAVGFNYVLNDGAGYRWDIQYYGSVGQGTNYAYAGGLYLKINGSSVHSSGRGWANAAGDEVEIGPYSRGGLRVYRRIKVFRDRGLARWLDIFENPSGAAVTVNARIYTNTNWSIAQQVYDGGKGQFGEKDCAFVTQTQGGSAPAVLHYVCGKRSKLRPTVSVRGNQISVSYNLTIPAGKTVVLCYFESQNNSMAKLVKLMKTFRPYRAMKDLSPAVRRLIVNMPAGGDLDGIELDRIASADIVVNKNGDPLYGTIRNEKFVVETLFGRMTIPAGQVIGMASAGNDDGRVRILLTGGQIVAGRPPADASVVLEMPSGGVLRVPISEVRQCAYRIGPS
ncbi:MAG: hypothetical protein J7M21_04530, partial [Planctomycetes bacterium]|nr:hypothetical protein [Planctomycetota bacterium]